MHREPVALAEIRRALCSRESLREGEFVTLQVENPHLLARVWARLWGRPVPYVTRDFLVTKDEESRLELTPIEFGQR